MRPSRLGELLLEAELVTTADIEAALASRPDLRLGSALIAAGAVDPDVVARTLAQQHGVPPARARDVVEPDPAARAAVPVGLQRRLCAVPYAVHGVGPDRILEVAMRDPTDRAALHELRLASGMRIDARVAPELLIREAVTPRTELPAAPAGELELADVPREAHAHRSLRRTPYTSPPRNQPATAEPPLTYEPAGSGALAGKLIKWALVLLSVVAVVYVGVRFKKCVTSTTRSVGTHYDSRLLDLGVDFPEGAGWRVAPTFKVDLGKARAEYFYRGGVPEAPVVAMVLTRGPAEDAAAAAERALVDLVKDVRGIGCLASEDRPGALVCKGVGTLTLFGRRRANVALDVHAWPLSTAELAMAVMINPDQTLSETRFILSSIVEQ